MKGDIHKGTPTAELFLRSLSSTRHAYAIEMIDGALAGDRVDPRWTAEERARVAQERERLARALESKR